MLKHNALHSSQGTFIPSHLTNHKRFSTNSVRDRFGLDNARESDEGKIFFVINKLSAATFSAFNRWFSAFNAKKSAPAAERPVNNFRLSSRNTCGTRTDANGAGSHRVSCA